jgi:hypothetical protein
MMRWGNYPLQAEYVCIAPNEMNRTANSRHTRFACGGVGMVVTSDTVITMPINKSVRPTPYLSEVRIRRLRRL